MKNKFSVALVILLATTLFSCTPFGDKVIIHENLEVFVTKDATEEEGKKLGDYFATLDTTNHVKKSIQLSKESDEYTVRLVVADEFANDATLIPSFQAIQYLLKENVFPGKKVNLILADAEFKNKKVIPEMTEAEASTMDEANAEPVDSTLNNE